tara:strand:+ start:1015 stop:1878 length:864 start_codon:yes stop_codon:yes gene_type:complete
MDEEKINQLNGENFMAEITKELSDLLKQVGESTDINDPSSAVWSLPQRRSTIVVKHKALEKIAVLKGMTFKSPQIIESNSEKGIVVVCVEGEKTEDGKTLTAWSFGEVSKSNYDPSRGGTKNVPSYIYAMAEKRAVDRVILKLLGMHGNYYSEAEADAFDEDEIKWGKKKDSDTKEQSDKKSESSRNGSPKDDVPVESNKDEKDATLLHKDEKSSNELSENDDNENTLYKVFSTFIDDCTEIPSLYSFWKKNTIELDKLKADDKEQYEKIRSMFSAQKLKLEKEKGE